jgi:hypothetical protein
MDEIENLHLFVIPAQAGIHVWSKGYVLDYIPTMDVGTSPT